MISLQEQLIRKRPEQLPIAEVLLDPWAGIPPIKKSASISVCWTRNCVGIENSLKSGDAVVT